MSVSDGQQVRASVVNPALASKTTNNTLVGIQDLNNTTEPLSGDRITNVQRYINELAESCGVDGIGDANKDAYSSENYISNGDDRKVAIGKIDAQVKTNSDGIATNVAAIGKNTTSTVTIQEISSDGTIAISAAKYLQNVLVIGDGAVTANVVPFSVSPLDGARAVLIGSSDSNTVEILNNDSAGGCILNGSALLKKYCILELVYISYFSRFVEIGRNF